MPDQQRQSPLTRLPATHLTASVADLQGNRNSARIRFWVERPRPRILSVDVRSVPEHHLVLCVQDDVEATDTAILCTDDVSKPLASWTRATTITASQETPQIHRLEVRPPDRFAAVCFLCVQRP